MFYRGGKNDGNFGVQIRNNGKDEIAQLSNLFGDIVDMFSKTVDEINKSYAKLDEGKMDVSINEGLLYREYTVDGLT